MPKIPGLEEHGLPPGIFSHGPVPDEGMVIEGAITIMEKVDVAKDMIPGGFGRFKRAAKGGGGRLPNRNG